jgi:4-hydroxy-tetrahydrodipicolinate synthase
MSLSGLVVPIPTLFGDDGALDPGRNAKFARALSEAKVDHLFALGSLGEFPSVTDPERARLLDSVIESASGKTDVWVGCGAPSTRQAVAYAEGAEGAGAAAVVVVPPYYLHPSLESIDRYYRAVAEAVDLPVLAYNIPSLVGYALPPALVHRLGADGTLAGAKDTSGSLASVRAFLDGRPDGFAILPGDDVLAAPAIAEGATGAVMGLANAVPRLGGELVGAALARDAGTVAPAQQLFEGLAGVVHGLPFPASVKRLAAELRGSEVGYRSPYDPLAPAEEKTLLDRLAPLRPALAPYLGR